MTSSNAKRVSLAVLMTACLTFSMVGTQMAFASTAGVKQVEAGAAHTLVLKTDGTLWATGANNDGQLGDGTKLPTTTFKQVLTGVKGIAAGQFHSLAIKTDGTLWVAGDNAQGQLGDGTTTDAAAFKQVLANVAQADAGNIHTMVLKTDGSLWATGNNKTGQLGDGSTTNSLVFKHVLSDVKFVAANGTENSAYPTGSGYSMAIKTDGTLWATGSNQKGNLGDGTSSTRSTFKQVLTNVVDVAAGQAHSIALRTDGTLWTTGYNYYGQLGGSLAVGSLSSYRTSFGQALTDVKSIAAGYYHSVAIKTDGYIYATGQGTSGQFTGVTNRNNFTKISVGQSNNTNVSVGDSHTLTIKDDGSLWATGSNGSGQLGDGTNTNKTSFVNVMAAPVYTPLDMATAAVIEAETLQTQASLDTARPQVVALPDGPDKDALSTRLNAVQATVDARVAAEAALTTGALESINIAMTLVNAMPDSAEKAALIQQLQEAQTEAEANSYPMGTDRGNVTVNAFINPTITMSMSTHVVDFNASDPTVASYEKPAVIGLTVQSNNTYCLTARALDDFKTGGASPLVMAADHLKAKASVSSDFLAMSKDADAVLLQDMPNTGGSQHELDFRFDSDWQMKPGLYSTTIKITASQL